MCRGKKKKKLHNESYDDCLKNDNIDGPNYTYNKLIRSGMRYDNRVRKKK